MRTNALISRTRAQRASVVNTLPAEVVRRLGITAGQELMIRTACTASGALRAHDEGGHQRR